MVKVRLWFAESEGIFFLAQEWVELGAHSTRICNNPRWSKFVRSFSVKYFWFFTRNQRLSLSCSLTSAGAMFWISRRTCVKQCFKFSSRGNGLPTPKKRFICCILALRRTPHARELHVLLPPFYNPRIQVHAW